jgi:hypothetical protein
VIEGFDVDAGADDVESGQDVPLRLGCLAAVGVCWLGDAGVVAASAAVGTDALVCGGSSYAREDGLWIPGSVGFVLSELVFRKPCPVKVCTACNVVILDVPAGHDESEQCQGGGLTLFVSALDGGSNPCGCSGVVIAFPPGRKR